MKTDNTPKAVQDCHDLLLWIIPLLDQFPRNRRFTLGERIESGILQVLELLTEAAYSRGGKAALLQRANLQLMVCRHLWRLAFEMQIITIKRYEHGARLLLELGAQVGGWVKASTP